MDMLRRRLALLIGSACVANRAWAERATFVAPGALPSARSLLAAHGPLLGVSTAGSRVIAVGQRGHVVVSDDGGRTWTQAEVPLSHDLTAVSFASEKVGWAVGHGGVLIGSTDGGMTWRKRLDGKEASSLAIAHFEKRVADGDAAAKPLLDRERKLAGYAGTQPFMDVYFESPSTGWLVGTFNRIFETRDGGTGWTPLMDRTENGAELHFYSVRGGPAGLVVTGEQGKVWVRDAATGRFQLRPTPFGGTLFGSVQAADGALVAFGMVGAAFLSRDRGQTWKRLETGSPAGITAGVRLRDGALALVNVAGQVLISRDGGTSFRATQVERPMSYTSVVELTGSSSALALSGAEGVRIVRLAQ